jgi:hypothetical protein
VGGGTDLVESAVSFSLAAFANVENLKLTGSALKRTATASPTSSSARATSISSTAWAAPTHERRRGQRHLRDRRRRRRGRRGGEADTDDLVRSSTTVNLTALAGGLIEHVELLGAVAIDATGNAGDNKLTGNSGDNELDGMLARTR